MKGYRTVCICCLARFDEAMRKYQNIYGADNVTSMVCKSGDCRVFVKGQVSPNGELEIMRATCTRIAGRNPTAGHDVGSRKRKAAVDPVQLKLMRKYHDVDFDTLAEYSANPVVYTITCGVQNLHYAKIVKVVYKNNRSRRWVRIASTLAWTSNGKLAELQGKAIVEEFVKVAAENHFSISKDFGILFGEGSTSAEVNMQFYDICHQDNVSPLGTFKDKVVKHIECYFPEDRNDETQQKIFKLMLRGGIYDKFGTPLVDVMLASHKDEYRYYGITIIGMFISNIRTFVEKRIVELATGDWQAMPGLQVPMLTIVKNQLAFQAMSDSK